jgi:4a-hydroxytetrahydrobiopterin dehydratase
VAREPLSEEQIQTELPGVDWDREGNEIVKTVVLTDFKEAMAFVNQVADLAEARDHHPDITISWNKVGLRLSTHSSGGLTALDFELARSIDALRK